MIEDYSDEVRQSVGDEINDLSRIYEVPLDVLRQILERTAEARPVPNSVQARVVHRPSLRAALAYLPPDQALPLFEPASINGLAWRESFFQYLRKPIPLYTRAELIRVLRTFRQHLLDHRGRIIGAPCDAPFAASPWLNRYGRLLYPHIDENYDPSELWQGLLEPDDWTLILERRASIQDLKVAVLQQLADGLSTGETGAEIANRCLRMINDILPPDEVAGWVRVDRRISHYDIASGSGLTVDRQTILGGLSDLLEVVGHCTEEADVCVFARTTDALGALRAWVTGQPVLRASSYYGAIAGGYAAQLEAACEVVLASRSAYLACWQEYRERLVTELRIAPYATPEPNDDAGTAPEADLANPFTELPEPAPVFEHSADYRSCRIRGHLHQLTPMQAHIIQLLHEAYRAGTPTLGAAHILTEIESTSRRLRDLFRSNPDAFRELIYRSGSSYRLNI